jgi:sialate O-acetylesterase
LAVSLLAGQSLLTADVRLPAVFGDHMVLQQGIPVPIWGWADEGERVTVEFRGQKVATRAVNGQWWVKLKPLRAGGPDAMVVRGHNYLGIQDVLVGEVWVCSGQSNMEWPLRASFAATNDIAQSANPNLRLFSVPKLRALVPTNDVRAAWQLSDPNSTPGFSAVAYYFGRALERDRRVPVGLIHSSWGGSPAEVWMSDGFLRGDPEYKKDIVDPYRETRRAYEQNLAQWEKERAAAAQAGQKFEKGRSWEPWRPTELYNGMIAPLIPYALRGAIWYQGESNASRARQYRRLFVEMIANWRRDWGQGDFTFLAVQLAPWDRGKKRALAEITASPMESDWAELREAQNLATERLPKVGVAVITDVGDKDDIHPAKKEPVGERLALAARVLAYRERVHGLSPTCRSVRFQGAKAIVRFNHVGPGLEARGGELTGFAVAGADRVFAWAKAEVVGKDQVAVCSPEVANPVAVRYGWADYPVVNLWSKDGLPASPFRTDDFPMVTTPKKP